MRTINRIAVLFLTCLSLAFAPAPIWRPSSSMFPDGRDYDFGKVKRGTVIKHTFRIVNTSYVPLEIVSVRSG